jgi:hypothetical protein
VKEILEKFVTQGNLLQVSDNVKFSMEKFAAI